MGPRAFVGACTERMDAFEGILSVASPTVFVLISE